MSSYEQQQEAIVQKWRECGEPGPYYVSGGDLYFDAGTRPFYLLALGEDSRRCLWQPAAEHGYGYVEVLAVYPGPRRARAEDVADWAAETLGWVETTDDVEPVLMPTPTKGHVQAKDITPAPEPPATAAFGDLHPGFCFARQNMATGVYMRVANSHQLEVTGDWAARFPAGYGYAVALARGAFVVIPIDEDVIPMNMYYEAFDVGAEGGDRG